MKLSIISFKIYRSNLVRKMNEIDQTLDPGKPDPNEPDPSEPDPNEPDPTRARPS